MEHNCKLLQHLENDSLRDYQSVPFWSWNDRLKPDHLRHQIQDMDKAGMGGFFMHARGGLETPYMGEEWFEAVDASVDEARKLGMNAWCYDENGWPSGFAGGALLEDPKNWAHYVRYEVKPDFDPAALAVYTLHNRKLRRVTAPAQGETEYHCVYDCTNSSVTDILNPEIVDAFIKETHQRYYERFADEFGKTIKGFFTDEPQYFRWNTAYSPMILTEFPKAYGYDPLDMLGSLFVTCDGCEGFRFRYWRLMNTLFCENFMGRIYRWCEEHNCQLTGHGIEENSISGQMIGCAGVMPLYEYEHIPGIDWLSRDLISTNELGPRQLSSAAQQLGKKHTITETFGCAGWDVTPKELKRLADIQYVNGVNMMCHHLYPYSIRGQRKRDYPAFYTLHNPWTQELDKFNAHYTNLGYLLAETKEDARVLIIHPMHSAYLTFDRLNSWTSVCDLNNAFQNLTKRFSSAGIGHHYADERLMEKYGSVDGTTITIGQCSYDCVVIPEMRCLDHSTVDLLRVYAANGGRLYLAGKTPDLMDGDPTDLSFLRSNTDFDAIADHYGRFTRRDSSVRATLRYSEEGSFLYAVNLSMKEKEAIGFKLPFGGAFRFDPMTKSCSGVEFAKTADGIIAQLTLAPGESVVLFRDDDTRSVPAAPTAAVAIPLEKQMKLTAPVENALTLDTAALSYDGENFTEDLPIMAISDLLLRRRENRDVWLRYRFNAEYIPDLLTLEVETLKNTSVCINGQEAKLPDTGVIDPSFCRGNIAPLTRVGENEVILKLYHHQTEHIYDVFNAFYYGTGEATEALINCLSYETNIEAIYLFGQFTVRADGGYRQDVLNTRVTDQGFTLCSPVSSVDISDITTQGFPFFRGSMTLETEVELTDTNYCLRCDGRVQYVKAWVGGTYAGMLLLNDTLDLSSHLRPGKNALRLELMASNRNLLGPFHEKDRPEPIGVGPDTFNMYGSWKDCKSGRYVPSYAFVCFGLDILQLEK